jgi:hypothetical protein
MGSEVLYDEVGFKYFEDKRCTRELVSSERYSTTTMKIAWLVSTLTLLPLLPFALLPEMFMERKLVGADAIASSEAIESLNTTGRKYPCDNVHHSDNVRTMNKTKARTGQRFLLLVLSWALSFYPFFSRMNGTFGTLPRRSPASVSTDKEQAKAKLETLQSQ